MSEYFTLNNIIDNCKINIEFEVQDKSWDKDLDILKEIALKVSKQVFRLLGLAIMDCCFEFCVILTNDASIKELNSQYLHKNKPTNVLSFPVYEINPNNKFVELKNDDGFVVLGDIIFAYGVIKNEASRDEKSFYDHFTHLIVHGILHLLGYDHEQTKEAEEMESLEVKILSEFNIKSPYN